MKKYRKMGTGILAVVLCLSMTGCFNRPNTYERILNEKYGTDFVATSMTNYNGELVKCYPVNDETTPFIMEKEEDEWTDNYVEQCLIKEPCDEIEAALEQQGYSAMANGTIVMSQGYYQRTMGYDIETDYWKGETNYQMSLEDFESQYADRMYYYIVLYMKRSQCVDKEDLRVIHDTLKECSVGRQAEYQIFATFLSDERFDEVSDYFQTEPFTFDYTRYSPHYIDEVVVFTYTDGNCWVDETYFPTEDDCFEREYELFQERRDWDDSVSIREPVVR